MIKNKKGEMNLQMLILVSIALVAGGILLGAIMAVIKMHYVDGATGILHGLLGIAVPTMLGR